MTAYRGSFGSPGPWTSLNAAYTTQNMTNQNYAVGAIMQIFPPDGSSTDTITHIGYRISTTTGTPASNSYKAGIQGVSTTTGLHDGTYLGGGTPASALHTPAAGVSAAFVWIALDNSIVVNRGDWIAPILERVGATDASNCINVGYENTQFTTRAGVPYPALNVSSWAKRNAAAPTMAVKSASNIYGYPAANLNGSTNLGGTTEVGFTFILPAARFSSAKLAGIRVLGFGPTGSSSNTWVASLYSSPTGTPSLLAQTTTDVDIVGSSTTPRGIEVYFSKDSAGSYLSSLPTLTGGTKYAVGLATTTAANGAISHSTLSASADAAGWWSDAMILSSRTLNDYPPSTNDTGSFAEDSTKLVYAELILADWAAPSGSSGKIAPIVMMGG